MKINVIIPAYNESERIGTTLLAYKEFTKISDLEVELYVVDDGSKDQTKDKCQEIMNNNDIVGEVLEYPKGTGNMGKGYAVRYGMLNSPAADYYYLADADLSSPWEVLSDLLTKAQEGGYNCVIGSRVQDGAKSENTFGRFLSGRLSNIAIKTVLRLKINDTQCGYKLFDKKCLAAFRLQKIYRFGFDFEILFLLRKLGLKTLEVGVPWENRGGSKVRLKDYIATFSQLLRVRFGKYDYKMS